LSLPTPKVKGNLLIILLFALVSVCHAEELFVCSAAGIRIPVKALGRDFEEAKKVKVRVIVSSSGKLARQIEMGAPCDLFISASRRWMDYLKAKGIVSGDISLAKTSLVLVSKKEISLKNWRDLCKLKRVAIGNYRFAPCGKYAAESFKNLGIWNCLKDRIVLANTVAQAATWTILGEVDAAVVYYSDYLMFKEKLKLLKILPEASHSPVIFKAAAVTEKGKTFLEFMCSKKEIFKKWGFEVVCR